MPPCRKKLHFTPNKAPQPLNKSWAIPRHKHNHPNFDWTKANSFQVKTFVTDGNEVIPNIIANANAVIPGNDMKFFF